MRTYLFPALFTAYKVGCRVEAFLRRFYGPPIWDHSHLAFQSEATLQSASPPVRFDSDSYPIGVDSHASRCMANKAHLFEDLHLNEDKGQVNGISDGLEIAGKGTFKFIITDDEGIQHTIRIKNSLYIPDMRRCLLSPQHWAQEAGDEHTWMELKRQWPYDCVLNWKGGKKTIPHQPSNNVPVFYTASSSTRYRAFAATFEAMEASFFQREKVLQYPGHRDLIDDNDPAEFIAEENLNYKENETSEDEGVNEDDETIKTSNVPSPVAAQEPPSEALRSGPLTFDPHPQEEEDEHTTLAANDDQAELMRWHYCLGHLPFLRLKQLAINGEIPKKLAKVAPPKCAGCLFGAMTKIPWRGKETKSSHEVFVATKPGECVSVDQMTSTELGFVAQLKGKLTKKRYCCATVFVNHYSCLRYIHPQVDDSSIETVAAKRAFETFAAQHGVRIQHYHCDNGRFSDNAFKQACHDARQQLTFCGVNAHFQNGIAKRSIRDLSESARKQLLHARA